MSKEENFRERLLARWASWSAKNYVKVLVIALLITIIMFFGVSRLKMEMTFYSILPQKSEKVQDLKQIVNDFSYASSIMVVVDGRSIDDPALAEKKVKETIDSISKEFTKKKYQPYIESIIGRMDTKLFREHGLMLSEVKDLERFKKNYSNLNLVPLLTHINDDFEREYSGNEENLADDETQAVAQFRGLGELLQLIENAMDGDEISETLVDQALDSYMLGTPYIMSNDNRMGIIIVQPSFTINDVSMLAPGVGAIEAGAKEIAEKNGIRPGLTGLTTVGRDEMVTSQQGLALSSIIALVLILGLLIFSFRIFTVPLISGVPLILGIFWTVGLSGLIIHRLNIMTAMYLVALLGLGIDFAIHLLSGYIQEKDNGSNYKDALINTLKKSGVGIITGAFTTAAAFFTLYVAKSDLIRELGIVAGIGILSELIAMLLLLPALIALREDRLLKKGKAESHIFNKIKIRSDIAGGLGDVVRKAPVSIAVIISILVIVLAFYAPKVELQDNILEMEAKGLESVTLNDEMGK